MKYFYNLALILHIILISISFSSPQISFDNGEIKRPRKFDIVFDDGNRIQTSPSCLTPQKTPGACKSLAQCAIFFAEIPSLLEEPCDDGRGNRGVCCPLDSIKTEDSNSGNRGGVLVAPPPPQVPRPKINSEQLKASLHNSLLKFNQRQDTANRILFTDNIRVPANSPPAKHSKFFQTTNDILSEGVKGQLGLEASKGLVKEFQLSQLEGTFGLPKISARGTKIGDTCPPVATCNPFTVPYRTFDGSCNNIKKPDWGKAGTAFQRVLPPKYEDGVSSPRAKSVTGSPLPSPRLLSTSFIRGEDRPYSNITLMLMQWGQFLDHDLTHTPIVKGPNSTSISCCSNGQLLSQQFLHPDCFPIPIPQNDPFFQPFGQQCMDFVRSLPAPRRDCNFGPREQMSQITSYLDGSNIYGSTDAKSLSLREKFGGRLLEQKTRKNKGLLPPNPSECSDSSRTKFCFSSGDARVNEQVELAVVHTIWMREHNRIADVLAKQNPNWVDETIFQETRRIVIAELQHITYNEFLPLILGPNYMRSFQLHPLQKGYSSLYSEEIDATITNEFASAAFRFGHTLVQGIIMGVNQFGGISQALSLDKTQFSPFPLYDDFDSFVRGLANQNCQQFDNFVSDALTKHLFQGSSAFGLDLMAINIQRGRDHGLPPYNEWRQICNLPKLRSFEDLNSIMSPESASILRSLYASVDDIDLFLGSLGEKPLENALLGPTFVCLVGDQFSRLRRGDRFFYEERSARFTEGQLDQIRRTSLARVLCDNGDEISVIQPLVMQKASLLNRRLPCSSEAIPGINLSFWIEDKNRQNRG